MQHYMENVVHSYTAVEFRRVFRLSVDCFRHICQLLFTCPEMHERSPDLGGRERISFEKKILVALRYFGHQENVRLLSDIFDIADSSVLTCRDAVIRALLNNYQDRFISWPLDQNTQADITEKFRVKKGFPGVLGCIDGTHIRIKAPKDHSQTYVNRKGYHSVILQAVCLHNMMFSSCFVGWPGSCHDARVLRNSQLWEDGAQACGQYHILGDGAYPIKQWLMTPYRDTGNLTREQKNYNYVHSATRTIIERAFALLKGRFRRLQYIDCRTIEKADDIVLACCVLHNVSISEGDIALDFMDPGDMNDVNVCNPPAIGPDPAGILKRDQISRIVV